MQNEPLNYINFGNIYAIRPISILQDVLMNFNTSHIFCDASELVYFIVSLSDITHKKKPVISYNT